MASAKFRRVLRDVQGQKVLTPILRASLLNPSFKGFTIEVEPWTDRPWDGWFHPSTHSTWTARQLFFYLMQPESIEKEQLDITSVLAITQGNFWHTFIQRLLRKHGILIEDEVPLVDKEHNRRGHMDGHLWYPETDVSEGFEFKTAHEAIVNKITSAELLREHKPTYYAQAQDYLDMAGLTTHRYLMMSLSYPFAMSEFVVEANPAYQAEQRAKYKTALQARDDQMPPPECCQPRSTEAKTCPVRRACPIGKVSK